MRAPQDGAPRPLYVVMACMRDIRKRADATDTCFDPLCEMVRRVQTRCKAGSCATVPEPYY